MNSESTLHNNDCLYVMRELHALGTQLDACITDPPYHIESIIKRFSKVSTDADTKTSADMREGNHQYARLAKNFAGQSWDDGEIAFTKETWELVYNLLKPGAYVLAFCDPRKYHKLATAIEAAGFEIRDMVSWVFGTGFPKSHPQPNGQGTRLKPGQEAICMARKPHKGTVWGNIQEHGTGGINIDPCRTEQGSMPTNFIHDGSDEVLEIFDKYGKNLDRFFYSTKTTKKERGTDNNHPTVKPIALMKYLCRLITPDNGIILDPFMGSGSTGVAAIEEGFKFVGIEKSPEYFAIASKRIQGLSNLPV